MRARPSPTATHRPMHTPLSPLPTAPLGLQAFPLPLYHPHPVTGREQGHTLGKFEESIDCNGGNKRGVEKWATPSQTRNASVFWCFAVSTLTPTQTTDSVGILNFSYTPATMFHLVAQYYPFEDINSTLNKNYSQLIGKNARKL